MEVGKTYRVNHQRKGTFVAEVKAFDSEWATLEIVSGEAAAKLEYNARYAGEELTVRRSFCTFTEQPAEVNTGSEAINQ